MTARALDARDLRAGGRWAWPQRAKNSLLFAVATSSLAIAGLMPARLLRACGRALGFVAWLVPGLRRIAEANVARALPDAAPGFVRENFLALGERLGEVVAGLDASKPLAALPFLPGAREVLDEAIAEGRGVVFASAHLGPWERVAASLVAAGLPITVVAREPYDPRFAPLYDRLRGGRGVRAIYRGAPGAGVALVRALRKGGVLAIPMDLATRASSIVAPFLGIPARTAVGPARLAIRTGAVVVVGAASPEGMFFERLPSLADENELTARINAALSARILAWPTAWLWMHERW